MIRIYTYHDGEFDCLREDFYPTKTLFLRGPHFRLSSTLPSKDNQLKGCVRGALAPLFIILPLSLEGEGDKGGEGDINPDYN